MRLTVVVYLSSIIVGSDITDVQRQLSDLYAECEAPGAGEAEEWIRNGKQATLESGSAVALLHMIQAMEGISLDMAFSRLRGIPAFRALPDFPAARKQARERRKRREAEEQQQQRERLSAPPPPPRPLSPAPAGLELLSLAFREGVKELSTDHPSPEALRRWGAFLSGFPLQETDRRRVEEISGLLPGAA